MILRKSQVSYKSFSSPESIRRGRIDIDSFSNLRDGPQLDLATAGSWVRLSYNRYRRHTLTLYSNLTWFTLRNIHIADGKQPHYRLFLIPSCYANQIIMLPRWSLNEQQEYFIIRDSETYTIRLAYNKYFMCYFVRAIDKTSKIIYKIIYKQ